MTKAELLKLIKDLPGNSEITVCDGLDTFELHKTTASVYPANLCHPTILVLDMGQQVDADFDLDKREPTKRI